MAHYLQTPSCLWLMASLSSRCLQRSSSSCLCHYLSGDRGRLSRQRLFGSSLSTPTFSEGCAFPPWSPGTVPGLPVLACCGCRLLATPTAHLWDCPVAHAAAPGLVTAAGCLLFSSRWLQFSTVVLLVLTPLSQGRFLIALWGFGHVEMSQHPTFPLSLSSLEAGHERGSGQLMVPLDSPLQVPARQRGRSAQLSK